MKKQSNTGDTINMIGNFSSANINIKTIMTNVTQMVNTAPVADVSAKEELLQLIEQLDQELEQVPSEHKKDVVMVATAAEDLIEAATVEEPNQARVQNRGAGLKQAAQNLAAVTPSVLAIASQVVDTIAKFNP